MRTGYRILVGKPGGKISFEKNLGVGGRLILKLILNK
jgi:hypothetical protein